MAATAVYITPSRIPDASVDIIDAGTVFSNIAATTAQFGLGGGTYNVDVVGSTFGTVTLQRLGPDGATWLNALAAFAANGGATAANLPAGQYRFALA